ncbi:hypothetical protein BN1723_017368, partial [Verticillium longisporum]
MATSPPDAPSRSAASSAYASRDSSSHTRDRHDASQAASIPVETLVEHLLAAKRSLSSMQHVLRANDLATDARRSHEEAAILCAQTRFLQRAIPNQTNLLLRVRRSLKRTYDAGKRDFTNLVRTMDATNEKLQETMGMLRNTPVEADFRPPGEEPRNLMDFVDEQSVHGMVDALKKCLGELQ